MTKWEVVIKAELVLHVDAPDSSGAEALAQDSHSRVYILEGWQDVVSLHDIWWMVDSVEKVKDMP